MFEITDGIRMDVPYFQVPNAVFEVGLDKHELIVYFYLARCGNQGARVFPSYNTIAKKCNISRSTVIKTVRSLELKQLIRKELRYCVERNQNYSNVYIAEHDVGGSVWHTPGGVYGKPGSVCAEPYKEPYYKEQEKKSTREMQKAFQDRPLHYGKHTFTSNHKKEIVKYYMETYERYIGKPHPNLRPSQWQRVDEGLDGCMLWSGESCELDVDEWKKVIDRHFETKYENCDYNILHFINDEIKMRRMYEAIY